MSKVQMLRSLVHQRLTAAAEEIFGLFERTIAEYEEELSSSKEENERQRKRLDAVFNPEVRIQRTDVQHLLVDKEEVPPEQQVWSSSLDQEDPEPPHIKEEQEELWTSQEGEQLQGLEEADIKFLFTPVPVKSENDEEEAQSSQLHQKQTEQTETEADGEDCGGPEPDRHPGPDKISNSSETEDIDDGLKLWRETQSSCNALRHNEVSDAANKPFSCSESKVLVGMDRLQIHLKRHTGEKTFTCQFCGKVFTKNSNLKTHLRVHTGEKPFTCSVCNTSFSLRSTLVNHMRVHTGEKPFSCSVCSRRFSKKANLTAHVAVHTLEKPFKCSVCDKKFTWPSQVKNHKCMSQSFNIQD